MASVRTLPAMLEHAKNWMMALPGGSADHLFLFLQLFVALALLGWAYDRGFRAAERGALIRWPLLIIGFGLALLVQHVHHVWWQPLIIAAAIIIAGLFGRNSYSSGLGIPVMLLATLLGYGLVLSALVFTLAVFIVFMLSPASRR